MIDLTRIGRLHAGLVGAGSGVAYATHCVAPGSLLLGGVVMGANFYLLRLIAALVRPVRRDPPIRRSRVVLAVAAFLLKFALFLGLLVAVFHRVPVEGMSFAVGVTLLLVACLVETARHEFAVRRGAR